MEATATEFNDLLSFFDMSRGSASSSTSALMYKKANPSQKKIETTLSRQENNLYVDGRIIDFREVQKPIVKPQDDTNAKSIVLQNERLDFIKSSLALSITQLAELFGVTRKAIYDWYDGAEPRPKMINRMEILINLLDGMPEGVDKQKLKTVWNIPFSGKSFLAVFNEENLDFNSFRAALKEKIDELSPKMVSNKISTNKTLPQLGTAHLAEFDKRADIG